MWCVDGFEDWYREVYPRVVTTLTAGLGSPEAAADATAEAFVKAFERWDRVRAMDRPDGWVYRVAFNAGRRHAARRISEAVAMGEAPPPPVQTPHAGEALVEFCSLLEGLPDRMRQVVALRHITDLTEEMTAEVLGISRSTVSSTLRDAHGRLEQIVAVREGR